MEEREGFGVKGDKIPGGVFSMRIGFWGMEISGGLSLESCKVTLRVATPV